MLMTTGAQVTIATGAKWILSNGDITSAAGSRHVGERLKTILLVDDNPGVREVAAELLRGAGYRVLEADCPEKALSIAASEGLIDLMMADIVMKGMRGTELGATVSKTRPTMEILYVSGYPDEYAMEVKQQVGARFLQKPFTAPALLTTVSEMLKRSENETVTGQ